MNGKLLHRIKVGVFPPIRGNTFLAYTTWYSPQWKGCCEHEVYVQDRKDAKAKAIEQHRKWCVK